MFLRKLKWARLLFITVCIELLLIFTFQGLGYFRQNNFYSSQNITQLGENRTGIGTIQVNAWLGDYQGVVRKLIAATWFEALTAELRLPRRNVIEIEWKKCQFCRALHLLHQSLIRKSKNIQYTWSETYFRQGLFPAYLFSRRQFHAIVIFLLKSISDINSGSIPRLYGEFMYAKLKNRGVVTTTGSEMPKLYSPIDRVRANKKRREMKDSSCLTFVVFQLIS